MARKQRNSVDYFPEWVLKPLMFNRIFDNKCKKTAFKYFRQSCSSFISKKKVREVIFSQDDYCCVECGSKNNLQIDHVVSVAYCFDNGYHFFCNSIENLQTLCKTCNIKKS